MASRLLYLGIALLGAAWLWTKALGRSIVLSRKARELRLRVGDLLVEHYKVINGGSVPAPWVEIENQSDLRFHSGSRLLTTLQPHQQQTYLARSWLTQRGGFSLGPTKVTVGDPFGLFRSARILPASQNITVLPMLFDVHAFPSPPGLLPGGRAVRGRSQDITPHAAGVREYAHGDPMKRIHWPTSVRRGQLMVKEFEQDPQAEVWLVLDSERGVHAEAPELQERLAPEDLTVGKKARIRLPQSTMEYAVSITASLARYFIGQRRAVGLLTVEETYAIIPAEYSSRQEAKILQTLAFVAPRGAMTLAGVVSAQLTQFPRGTSVVLITTTKAQDLPRAVGALQRRGLHPIVVLLQAETFGQVWRRGDGAVSLRDESVPVLRVSYGEDLGAVLASYSPGAALRDAYEWRSIPSLYST